MHPGLDRHAVVDGAQCVWQDVKPSEYRSSTLVTCVFIGPSVCGCMWVSGLDRHAAVDGWGSSLCVARGNACCVRFGLGWGLG